MIRLLGVVLSGLVLASPAGAWNACDAKPDDRVQILQKGTTRDPSVPVNHAGAVPGYDLFIARKAFLDGTDGAANLLRAYAFDTHPLIVEANRQYLAREGWAEDFIALLDGAIQWVHDICAKDAAHVYEQAQQIEASARTDPEWSLSQQLRWHAANKRYPPARFDQAMLAFSGRTSLSERFGRDVLRKLGDQNYAPALLELIARNLDGRGFTPHKAEAYYWTRRAQKAGLDVEDDLQALEITLSAPERQQVEAWLAVGTHPQDWDR